MLNALAQRFPDDSLEIFSMFNPRYIKKMAMENYQSTFNYLETFGYAHIILESHFKRLRLSLDNSEFYKKFKTDAPEVFWPNALVSNELNWTAVMIEVTSFQPVGTRQVENGYSQLNFIVSQWQPRMSIEMNTSYA